MYNYGDACCSEKVLASSSGHQMQTLAKASFSQMVLLCAGPQAMAGP